MRTDIGHGRVHVHLLPAVRKTFSDLLFLQEMCYQFWPEALGRYLHITVETTSVEDKKDYTVYKYRVHDGVKVSRATFDLLHHYHSMLAIYCCFTDISTIIITSSPSLHVVKSLSLL